MKKALIILALLLVATWLVLLPGLVGLYLARWLPSWLDEDAQTTLTEQHSGWFSSSIQLEGPDWRLSARARHVPPTRAAWLALAGQIEPLWLDQPLDFSGHFGLAGNSQLKLSSSRLNARTQPEVRAGAFNLDLEQSGPGRVKASLALADLELNDTLGNHLAAGDSQLRLQWQRLDAEHTALNLEADLAGPAAALRLRIEPIRIDAARELLQGIEQLQGARPDSMDQQLALLTIAGAWQQLAEAGLEIELAELSLDRDTAFVGRWTTAGPSPLVRGGGHHQSLHAWLATVIGFTRAISPQAAEREASAWMAQLIEQQWLRIEDDRFEFQFPAVSLDEH